MVLLPDSSVTLAGRSENRIWIMQLDPDGAVLWQRHYALEGIANATSIEPTPDGGYIVGGIRSDVESWNPDTLVLRLDGSGGVQWQKSFNLDGGHLLSRAAPNPDGGYFVSSSINVSSTMNMEFWVLKLDESGMPGRCPAGIISEPWVTVTDSSAVEATSSLVQGVIDISTQALSPTSVEHAVSICTQCGT